MKKLLYTLEPLWLSTLNMADLAIVEARAHLHRVVLSHQSLRYPVISSKLGGLMDDTANNWHEAYARKYVRKFHDITAHIFLNPVVCRPSCLFEIIPSDNLSTDDYQERLYRLNQQMPGFKPSKVEYAVDIYCRDSQAVRLLFWTLKRVAYVPYYQEAKLFGGEENEDSINPMEAGYNFVFKVGNNSGCNLKIYERGSQSCRNGKGWSYADLDRVRIEFTADRDELRRRKLNTLIDLFPSPKLSYFLLESRKAVRFLQSNTKKLSKPWSKFYTRNGSLQEEIRHVQSSCQLNVTNELCDVKGFRPIYGVCTTFYTILMLYNFQFVIQ